MVTSTGKQKKTKKRASQTLEPQKSLGVCQICGERDAKARCIKCGTPVCTACYFHLVSLCKRCVSEETAKKWKQEKPNWEKKLGVEWID